MISIVTPVYNEEGNVVYFHEEVTKVMKGVDMDYEIIYVNDGSKDRTDDLRYGFCHRGCSDYDGWGYAASAGTDSEADREVAGGV